MRTKRGVLYIVTANEAIDGVIVGDRDDSMATN